MKSQIKKHQIPYTQISNDLLNDQRITLKAKGLYCFMFSKPDDWNFTIKSMAKQLKDGAEAVSSGLKELKKSGWLRYYKKSDGTGVYMLNSEPKPDFQDKVETNALEPKPENPYLGVKNEPKPENPNLGKSGSYNNKDLLKELNKERIGPLLLLFENLFNEKFDCVYSYDGKYNKTYQENALKMIIKNKGRNSANFLKSCFALNEKFFIQNLSPHLILKNINMFSSAIANQKNQKPVAAAPKKELLKRSDYLQDYEYKNAIRYGGIDSANYIRVEYNGEYVYCKTSAAQNAGLIQKYPIL